VHPAERSSPDHLTFLREGEIEVRGRLPWSSNGTYLVEIRLAGDAMAAVYKPERGERPLWDYPPGLYRREVAAYLVSEALGWGIVPETVVRDGPFGTGSVQRFVEADEHEHYFTLVENPEHHDALRAICAFDLLINNGDRKSGHCLLSPDGTIYGIDHGLCLHDDPKLRTVIWDFAGEPIPDRLLPAVTRLAASAPAALSSLLAPDEQDALASRATDLCRKPVFPGMRYQARNYPWPLV
jgi:uncharacterized repeat protein (TIGR03843 family)